MVPLQRPRPALGRPTRKTHPGSTHHHHNGVISQRPPVSAQAPPIRKFELPPGMVWKVHLKCLNIAFIASPLSSSLPLPPSLFLPLSSSLPLPLFLDTLTTLRSKIEEQKKAVQATGAKMSALKSQQPSLATGFYPLPEGTVNMQHCFMHTDRNLISAHTISFFSLRFLYFLLLSASSSSSSRSTSQPLSVHIDSTAQKPRSNW